MHRVRQLHRVAVALGIGGEHALVQAVMMLARGFALAVSEFLPLELGPRQGGAAGGAGVRRLRLVLLDLGQKFLDQQHLLRRFLRRLRRVDGNEALAAVAIADRAKHLVHHLLHVDRHLPALKVAALRQQRRRHRRGIAEFRQALLRIAHAEPGIDADRHLMIDQIVGDAVDAVPLP